jgi:hypothetical protein
MKNTPDDDAEPAPDTTATAADDDTEGALASTHLILVNRLALALRHVPRAASPAADAGDYRTHD